MNRIKIVIVAVCFVLSALCYVVFNRNDGAVLLSKAADTSAEFSEGEQPDKEKESPESGELYELKAELKELRKSLDSLRTEGIRIYVPEGGEGEPENAPAAYVVEVERADDGLVNINTADRDELMELPGIGEAKAESIISYREDYGGFMSIEEIMNISGIKEAAFEKLKDLITV